MIFIHQFLVPFHIIRIILYVLRMVNVSGSVGVATSTSTSSITSISTSIINISSIISSIIISSTTSTIPSPTLLI